jgi:drug/metabolite transporter (DMT)-like permease
VSPSERTIDKMARSDVLKMIFVTFLWALCFPLIKVGLDGGTSPLIFFTLRSLAASILLFAVATRRKEPIAEIRKHWLLLCAIGLAAFFGYFGMVLGGVSVNPGIASVIGNSHPIVASILAVIFLSESLSFFKITGLIFGFVGVILSSVPSLLGETSNSLSGIGLILLSAVATGVGNVLFKKISNSKFPTSVLAIQFAFATVLLFLSALLIERPLVINWDLGFMVSLLVLSFGGTALADIIWIDLLKSNSLTKLNVFIFLTPAFSILMGIVFFKERLGLWEMLGIGAILSGVFMILQNRTKDSKILNAAGRPFAK